MSGFLIRRLGMSAVVLFGVAAIVFFSLFLTGDPAVLMLPPDASRAEIDTFRHAMGFDQPVWLQFLHYLGHVLTGDFGRSLRFRQPALGLIADSGDLERSIRSIMNTESGDHEHLLAWA